MCGINMILRKDGKAVEREDIVRMCSALSHRGPDGAGYALLNNGALGFGHVRLSIIDLQDGDQPLYNEDGSVCITFNGEIYDYKRLREKLMRQGHRFRTYSDTEVIVHLYEQYGMDFIHRINGEFAFILWDAHNRRLLAARDRCGVKPLFYWETDQEIIISSEVKGIFALSRVPRRINPDFMIGPMLGVFARAISAFEGVHNLNPGSFLTLDSGNHSREVAYWRPTFKTNSAISFSEAKHEVRRLLTRAVERRMVADVPVGTYLSGGLDSTLICGLAAAQSSKLKAFSVGFGKSVYDETDAARQTAAHYGAQFEAIDCSNEILAENFLKTIFHIEQPIANPNSIAKQQLSRLVQSKGYKVCLTGEGSDEVFGGYAEFKMEKLWRMRLAGGEQARRERTLWKRFKKIERPSQGILWNRSNHWRKGEHVFGYPSFQQTRASDFSRYVNRILTREVVKRASYPTPYDFFLSEFPPEQLSRLDPFNATKLITYNQLVCYIIPCLGDRVEMANSVECRTPFLDRDLIEFAATVDTAYFMDIDTLMEKHLLRAAFADLLPPVVAGTHKYPFLAPNWQSLCATAEGARLLGEFLSPERVRGAGLFCSAFIRQMLMYRKWLPKSFSIWFDTLTGMTLSMQALHYLFVEQPIATNPDISIRDRSWPNLRDEVDGRGTD
jgi:asparagine synthase (glutamine-hydrolysing)